MDCSASNPQVDSGSFSFTSQPAQGAVIGRPPLHGIRWSSGEGGVANLLFKG